jgi:hypothetical protein
MAPRDGLTSRQRMMKAEVVRDFLGAARALCAAGYGFPYVARVFNKTGTTTQGRKWTGKDAEQLLRENPQRP